MNVYLRAIGFIATIVLFFFFLLYASVAHSNQIPKQAYQHIPVVLEQIQDVWPELASDAMICAQIEKESCIHINHSRCWNTRSEFKTDREYGFGLGMFTVTSKFNVFEELKALDSKMASWKWEDRYNPTYQIRGIILKDKQAYLKANKMGLATTLDRLAITLAWYNGGSQLKDQLICKNTEGCDPTRWYPKDTKLGIKDVGWRSNTILPGYGKSFNTINKEYPDHILFIKRPKYEPICNRGKKWQ